MKLTLAHQARTAGLVVLAFTVVSGFTPAAADPPAAETRALIEKHVGWLGGWDALNGLRDISLEGTLEVSGLNGTLRVVSRADGYQRTEFDLKVMKGVEVITPGDGWEINPSGQIEPMGVHKLRDSRRGVDRTFSRHLAGKDVVITRLGSEEKDGATWEVVRFSYPEGDWLDLFIDPKDGSSEWTRQKTDQETFWVHLEDVREVDGLRVPFRQLSIYENPVMNQTITWTRVTANTGVADSEFARPDAAASIVRLAEGAVSTDWMPIELHFGRYIYLKGTINGQATDILLDSGAGMTVLDKAEVGRLGLTSEGSIAARGTGGMSEAGIVQGITLTAGQLTIGPVTAATIDLAGVGRQLGRGLPVILGKEVFHNVIVDVDYPNSRIRFHDPERYSYDGPGRRLPVIPAADGHRSIEIAIENLPPAVVGLDTGQGGALSVFKAYTDEHQLLEKRDRVSAAKGGGVGGTTIFSMATLRSVTIAGYTLHQVPTAFHREDVGGAFDTDRQAGNLGAGILAKFRVLFDYSHDCLWLEPGPGWDTEPFPRDKTGLSPQYETDRLVVQYVAPGSPAQEGGWKEGDVIVAIDGEPVGPGWFDRVVQWQRAKDGTEVSFKLADGSTRKLVMRSYY